MRNLLVLFVTFVLLISCSPRYTASFQNYTDNYHTSTLHNPDNIPSEKLTEPEFIPVTNTEPIAFSVSEVLVSSESHPYLVDKVHQAKVATDDIKVNPKQEKEPTNKQTQKQGDDSGKTILRISIILLVLGIVVMAVGIIFLITVLANIE